MEHSRQAVRILGVVNHQLGEVFELRLGGHEIVRGLGIRVDAVVEHTPVVSQRDGVLSRFALALPHQEAPVYPAAQRELGLGPRDVPVEPRVLLEAVHLGDVRRRDPADLPAHVRALAPVPVLALARDLKLLSLEYGELSRLVRGVVVFGDIYIDIRRVILRVQEVVKRVPPVVLGEGVP